MPACAGMTIHFLVIPFSSDPTGFTVIRAHAAIHAGTRPALDDVHQLAHNIARCLTRQA